MCLLYLTHELRDNKKTFVKNDAQQSHQVFMLELPGRCESTSNMRINGRY